VYSVLVADDNSNIQKMVSLALKDEGIDVVAVGNGEAAVRRLAEAVPDLILADIFMPVRNGYEVCEYVKRDERFQHIPVILLIGAFDPLDDEEVRRVRADGVLKKPFVPPDPLIALVKSTLERLPPRKPELAPAPAEPPAPSPTALEPPPLAPEPVPEEEPEEFPAPAFSMGEDRPLAFGSLLDAPPEAPEPPEPVVAPRQNDEPFQARSIPDDDVAASQLESVGYFSLDTPAAAEPAAEESHSYQEPASDPAPAPDPFPGPFSEFDWSPPAAPPEDLPAAPAQEMPAEPRDAAPATEGLAPELPGSIASEEPVMRSTPPASEAEPPALHYEEPAALPQEPAHESYPASEPASSFDEREEREDSYSAPVHPDPALIEAVVEQVLTRLRPQLDQVAREVLRPVAEALLQRELEKASERIRN
jgi:CheY-like chemotaxis protein